MIIFLWHIKVIYETTKKLYALKDLINKIAKNFDIQVLSAQGYLKKLFASTNFCIHLSLT